MKKTLLIAAFTAITGIALFAADPKANHASWESSYSYVETTQFGNQWVHTVECSGFLSMSCSDSVSGSVNQFGS